MLASAPEGARPRGAARREALLDAALRLVAEVGVDAVTHRRVAQVAGLPLASTTYWFQSKEHLLTAALQRAADHDIERLREFLGDSSERAADPLELAVGALIGPDDGVGQTSRSRLLATYVLMLEAARRPALRDATARWTDAYLEALTPLFAAAGSRHPRSDAELLIATADGLIVDQLASDDASALAPRLRRVAQALANA